MTQTKTSRFPEAPDFRGIDVAKILPIVNTETDSRYFDPRSQYAENYWLPILGPSTLWLLRRIADRFDDEPDGFELDLLETSRALGIAGNNGRTNPFYRALGRVVTFRMGHTVDDATLAVRRFIPPLHHGQVRRLPARLRRDHNNMIELLPRQQAEELVRAHKLATTLLAMGDSPDDAERQLISWGNGANTAKEAVDQAWRDRARNDNHWHAPHMHSGA